MAGYTVALLALLVVALLVIAVNAFALLFVLPAVNIWLWLPADPDRAGPGPRPAVRRRPRSGPRC